MKLTRRNLSGLFLIVFGLVANREALAVCLKNQKLSTNPGTVTLWWNKPSNSKLDKVQISGIGIAAKSWKPKWMRWPGYNQMEYPTMFEFVIFHSYKIASELKQLPRWDRGGFTVDRYGVTIRRPVLSIAYPLPKGCEGLADGSLGYWVISGNVSREISPYGNHVLTPMECKFLPRSPCSALLEDNDGEHE